jgi:hypothetical protein
LLVCFASALSPWKVTVMGKVEVLSRTSLVTFAGSLVFFGVAVVGDPLRAVCLTGVAATLPSTFVFCHEVSK